MRDIFIRVMRELLQDPKVLLLTGDVGYGFLEPLQKDFPQQFVNCGVAEQNMLGVAAGLSYENYKPYCYTMAPFILLRAAEQLRNDICYANANVKLLGVKGGESYKKLGLTHSLIHREEAFLLASLPNINYYVSPETFEEDLRKEYLRNGPAYFRI